MAFCIIGGLPVFLSPEQERELDAIATEGWSPIARVMATVATDVGKKLRVARDKASYTYLESEFKRDPTSFFLRWVAFCFTGDSAPHMAKRVLSDYGLLYGHCWIVGLSLKEFLPDYNPVIDMFTDDLWAHPYPQERLIEIRHRVRPRYWWWKWWPYRMADRLLTTLIDTNDVIEVEGTLQKFRIRARTWTLVCDKQHMKLISIRERSIKDALRSAEREWEHQNKG